MKKVKVNDSEEKIVPVTTNPIFTQKLNNYTPKCSITCALIFLSVATVFFAAFGIGVIVDSNSVKEISIDYTNCTRNSTNYCSIELDIKEDFEGPVFIYYNLSSFYTNHRDFFTSKSYEQLRNKEGYKQNATQCAGALTNNEIFDFDKTKLFSYTGKPLNGSAIAWPCGLAPKAYFQDTFKLTNKDSKLPIIISETNITTSFDRKYAFINNENSTDIAWLDVTNEHFIVWMQTESWKSFRKTWGRIDNGVKAGKYQLEILSGKFIT